MTTDIGLNVFGSFWSIHPRKDAERLRLCVSCGGQFRPHHQYSTACAACEPEQSPPAGIKSRLTQKSEAICPECAKTFMARKSQVYCCDTCAGAKHRRRYQADVDYRVRLLRKAHEDRAPGELPSEVRLVEMLTAAIESGRCPYCGDAVAERDWALDHIIPVSRGGTNLGSNLLFICAGCNCAKGGKPLDEFLMHSLPHTLEAPSSDSGAESDAGAADGTMPGRGAKSAQGELA